MKVNVSVLEVPMKYQVKKWDNSKLKDNMFLTAEPLYETKEIEFKNLINIIKSDYRQYSPFEFLNKTKKSENWINNNQNLLILDVDDGMTIEEAKEEFAGYTYLIATTKSHQVEKKGIKCDRFRVILVSDNIPVGDEYFNLTKILEKKYQFIDKQVNTKTGAFLGSADCLYWYNYGDTFDCDELIEMDKRISKLKQTQSTSEAKPSRAEAQYNQNRTTRYESLPAQEIKNRLTREIVADIVSSCGYEVNRKFMFKWRLDERTPSASISPDLLIKDFGSDLSTDAIGFVMEAKKIDFKTAVNYVSNFTGAT